MTETVAGQEKSTRETDAGERPLPELEADLLALASDLAAAECRWLQMVEEFDRREGWAGFGVLSCAHWLSWRCGLSLTTAHEKVRVARALRTLPAVLKAFESGELSYARTRAIVRAATPENEEHLVELARHSTGAQLEKIVRATVGVRKLDEVKERAAQCYVHSHWEDDGSLIFRARLGPEQGAALLRAIDAAQAADWRAGADTDEVEDGVDANEVDPAGDTATDTAGDVDVDAEVDAALFAAAGQVPAAAAVAVDPTEHEHPPATREERILDRVDALVTVAEAYLAGQAPVAGADVYQVVVHVRDDAPPHIEDGPALPTETALRLACDSSAYCVHRGRRGQVLDVGRKTRRIHSALRKALWLRDGGCRFPGCQRTRRVDAHHVRHWLHLGPTALDNLVLLCRRHHGSVHEGGFGLVMGADGQPIFTLPDGSDFPEVPALLPSTGDPASWHRVPVASHAVDTRWLGDRLDLVAAVDSVLRAKRSRPVGTGDEGRAWPSVPPQRAARVTEPT